MKTAKKIESLWAAEYQQSKFFVVQTENMCSLYHHKTDQATLPQSTLTPNNASS